MTDKDKDALAVLIAEYMWDIKHLWREDKHLYDEKWSDLSSDRQSSVKNEILTHRICPLADEEKYQFHYYFFSKLYYKLIKLFDRGTHPFPDLKEGLASSLRTLNGELNSHAILQELVGRVDELEQREQLFTKAKEDCKVSHE